MKQSCSIRSRSFARLGILTISVVWLLISCVTSSKAHGKPVKVEFTSDSPASVLMFQEADFGADGTQRLALYQRLKTNGTKDKAEEDLLRDLTQWFKKASTIGTTPCPRTLNRVSTVFVAVSDGRYLSHSWLPNSEKVIHFQFATPASAPGRSSPRAD